MSSRQRNKTDVELFCQWNLATVTSIVSDSSAEERIHSIYEKKKELKGNEIKYNNSSLCVKEAKVHLTLYLRNAQKSKDKNESIEFHLHKRLN